MVHADKNARYPKTGSFSESSILKCAEISGCLCCPVVRLDFEIDCAKFLFVNKSYSFESTLSISKKCCKARIGQFNVVGIFIIFIRIIFNSVHCLSKKTRSIQIRNLHFDKSEFLSKQGLSIKLGSVTTLPPAKSFNSK